MSWRLSDFDRLHSREHNSEVRLSFDLLALGDDVRQLPLHKRKHLLAKLLARCGDGIHLNPHMEGEIGASIFQHACKLGLKGIVSKHRDGAYVKKPERNEWRRA
jgi:bifunctional non-homologous end joining protein LigD